MKRLLSFLISFFALIAIVLMSIHTVIFNADFFVEKFTENNTAERLNVSETDLYNANFELLAYVQDFTDNMDIEIIVNGESESFFNQKEKDHMVDVKALYLNSKVVFNLSLLAFVILNVILRFFYPKDKFSIYRQGLYDASIVIGTILAAIVFYALIDFNAFWTSFHKVFFSNDLWLLNPATDRMIVMYQLNFFYDMVFNIFTMLAFYLSAYIIGMHFDLLKEKLFK